MKALLLTALLAAGAWSSEDPGGDSGARTGPDKAVLEASAGQGLKLSDRALKRLGVRTERLSGRGPFRLPIEALVYSTEDVGVYRLRDGWYKHVDVAVSAKDKASVSVSSGELRAGDQVVVAGAALLRMAELDVLGGEEAGHGH